MSQMLRNSKIADEWIAAMVAANPVSLINDPATGQWTGNVSTGPVRLSWINLFEPKEASAQAKARDPNAQGKYGTDAMFPFGSEAAVNAVLWPIWSAQAMKDFPERFSGGQYIFHVPWIKAQAAKQNYPGFTPGLPYISTSTKFKPQIVDHQMNPIADPKRVYPGVWAILAINVYTYGINPPQIQKGVGWGLQSVMLIADDTPLAGGGIDPSKAFAGAKVDARFTPQATFGVPPGVVAPGSILPPPGVVQQGQAPLAPPPMGGYGAPPAAPATGPSLADMLKVR